VYQRRNPRDDEQATAAAVDAARAVEAIAVHDRRARRRREDPSARRRARLNPAWWRLSLIGEDDGVPLRDLRGSTRSRRRGVRHATALKTLAFRRRGACLPTTIALLHRGDARFRSSEEHTAQLSHDKARAFQQDFKDARPVEFHDV
jgi:hypothetical protein